MGQRGLPRLNVSTVCMRREVPAPPTPPLRPASHTRACCLRSYVRTWPPAAACRRAYLQIYGQWDGSIAYLEPMVSQQMMLSRAVGYTFCRTLVVSTHKAVCRVAARRHTSPTARRHTSPSACCTHIPAPSTAQPREHGRGPAAAAQAVLQEDQQGLLRRVQGFLQVRALTYF